MLLRLRLCREERTETGGNCLLLEDADTKELCILEEILADLSAALATRPNSVALDIVVSRWLVGGWAGWAEFESAHIFVGWNWAASASGCFCLAAATRSTD